MYTCDQKKYRPIITHNLAQLVNKNNSINYIGNPLMSDKPSTLSAKFCINDEF